MAVVARLPIDAPNMDTSTPSARRSRTFPTVLSLALVLLVTTAWTSPGSPSRSGADPGVAFPAPALVDVAASPADGSDHGTLAAPLPGLDPVEEVAEKQAARLAKLANAIARPVRTSPANIATAHPQPDATPTSTPAASRFTGRNRFWIPSLGMSYRVHLFECSRNRPPDNYIYRWGCAGRNNVYILGHAATVMRPLHDLYVSGGLRKGMLAVYADGAGRIHRFRVTTWRVVDPVESAWAIADQPVSSMTLQTCVGPQGRLRLNVRLVEVR